MPEEKDKKTLKLKEDKKEVKKDGKKEVKKEGAKKKPKFNLIQKWREMVAELKKVTWPSRKELIRPLHRRGGVRGSDHRRHRRVRPGLVEPD